jgi:Mg2+ and Co2+ transporter CorA
VIKEVWDRAYWISMNIAKYTTINPIKQKQYKVLSGLTEEEQEAVCDLLSETITHTIYHFLELFEEKEDDIKLLVKKDGQEYDLTEVSEKMGSEIACEDEEGWIQKFSKFGRFVL